MDLQSPVSAFLGAIVSPSLATIKVSLGPSAPSDSGKQTPTYQTFTKVRVDVQAMSTTDLEMVDALNVTGVKRTIYVHGRLNGIVRPLGDGGDLIILTGGPNAGTWLIVMVPEQWPDWCRCLVTLQNTP